MNNPTFFHQPDTLDEDIELELDYSENCPNGLLTAEPAEKNDTSSISAENNEHQPILMDTNENPENLTAANDELMTSEQFNIYYKKKIITQSMMDIALLSSNANQMGALLSKSVEGYPYFSLVLLSASIILQILVGITMLLSYKRPISDVKHRKSAIKFNHFIMMGIFLITTINILLPIFEKGSNNNNNNNNKNSTNDDKYIITCKPK